MARYTYYDDNAAPPPSPPSVNGGDRRTKRPRGAEDDDDDCISRLPDDVLIGIISRLPIRDAVATGAVSARWRHLWKHVPRISLRPIYILGGDVVVGLSAAASWDDDDARADRLAAAASFVLRHHHRGGAGVVVDRLVLALPLTPSRHAALLDQTVEFAASSRIQELHLSLPAGRGGDHHHPYDFPHWRLAAGGGTRLRRLFLSGDVGLLALHQRGGGGGQIEGLAQLTRLDLTGVAVDDAAVASILSTCANLALLELKRCHRLVHVAASHDGLRLLNVDSCVGLESVAIDSTTLLEFTYRGHNKVDVVYRHAPAIQRLVVMLLDASECPLDCVPSSGGAVLPKLKDLILQFPSPLRQAQQELQQGWRRFEGLDHIVLLFKTPWRDHVASVASLLVVAPLVRYLRVEAYDDLPVPPPKEQQTIQWPEHCDPKRLESIAIGGFSGEPELMELAFFLLHKSPAIRTVTFDTHRLHYLPNYRGWRRDKTQDPVRCYYARGVLWTHLAPRIPSTVKLTII